MLSVDDLLPDEDDPTTGPLPSVDVPTTLRPAVTPPVPDDAAHAIALDEETQHQIERVTTHVPIPAPLRSSSVSMPSRIIRMPLIIQGSGTQPILRPVIRRRPRPFTLHLSMTVVTLCMILTTLVAAAVIHDPALLTAPLQGFAASASALRVPAANDFVKYQVRPGDTIEGIAKQFNVAIGGIYKLNALYLGDEIALGQVIKIPSDPSFGTDYKPTAPPVQAADTSSRSAVSHAPQGTVYGSCQFCSIAGYSTGGLCAPPSQTQLGFGLIQPNPNAHWVRGFTWFHNGVDISTGQFGTPIIAAQDGQVIYAGWDPFGGGNAVKINHCWGLSTSYCHMEQLTVKLGQFVHKGDVIGLQGSTGNSTGPHLHFMVWWDNQYVDPLTYYTHLGFPYP